MHFTITFQQSESVDHETWSDKPSTKVVPRSLNCQPVSNHSAKQIWYFWWSPSWAISLNTFLMPEDLMEGHSFGDSGIKIKQELKVREKTSIIFRKDILDFIVTTTIWRCPNFTSNVKIQNKQWTNFRRHSSTTGGILALLLFFYTKLFDFMARARSPVIYKNEVTSILILSIHQL